MHQGARHPARGIVACAGGGQPDLTRGLQGVEHRLVQRGLDSPTGWPRLDAFWRTEADHCPQSERQGEERRDWPLGLDRLGDLGRDRGRGNRHELDRVRTGQGRAAVLLRPQHASGVGHRLPLHLRLHQQPHLPQRHRQAVVDDGRTLLRRSFERDPEKVLTGGQIQQPKRLVLNAKMADEPAPQARLILVARLVYRRLGKPDRLVEVRGHGGGQAGLPCDHDAQGALHRSAEVRVLQVPGVRIGQCRERPRRLERQHGKTR